MRKLGQLTETRTEEELVTVQEAARILSFHPLSIHRLVGRRVLRPSARAGRALLFRRQDIDRYVILRSGRRGASARPETIASATISVKSADGRRVVRRLKGFVWSEVPTIHKKIEKTYGDCSLTVRVQSRYGIWHLRHHPGEACRTPWLAGGEP
jgi:hypothetical protein